MFERGDKFIIEIGDVYVGEAETAYRIQHTGIIVYEMVLERFEKYHTEKINVGDKIRVTNSGHSYSNFCRWFEGKDLDVKDVAAYGYHKEVVNGTTAEVLHIAPHDTVPNTMIYFCKDTQSRQTFLMDEGGIEKC